MFSQYPLKNITLKNIYTNLRVLWCYSYANLVLSSIGIYKCIGRYVGTEGHTYRIGKACFSRQFIV